MDWRFAAPDPDGRAALQRAGVPPLAAMILSARGVSDELAVRELLSAPDRPVPDGMGMRDMDRAVARVALALERGEHIAVYGDYDVDGITATCLLTEYLTSRGAPVTPYIPDRLEEGYGLNEAAAASLAAQGVTLIVTVDCGVTAVEEVRAIASMGVDVVVTDHHECKDALPDACAVVDPCRPDCPYPFKGLAGVGVALKLCMSLAGPDGARAVLEEYADLAAVGTVADVMPMLDENRAIVLRGLAALANTKRLGLAALIREAGMDHRPLNSVSVGFALAPRINAAGRMGRARLAVDLLLARDEYRAQELAQELCRLNRERQQVEGDIFAQCLRLLGDEPPRHAIVLADPNWHQGVVGVVASRLAEQYGCPVFMICLSDEMGKGSCRSGGGIDLFSVLEGCDDLLEAFGGHAQAAGFTVREKNVLALAQRIRAQVAAQEPNAPRPSLSLDALLDDPSLLDVRGVEFLDRLEPFGNGNPRPALAITGAQVAVRSLVGNGRHLKLKLIKNGVTLDAIFFSAGADLPPVGSRVDVAFSPQINEYRGVRSVQLHLLDLRPSAVRAEPEPELYRRFRAGDPLSPEQARALLPPREAFVALWRRLERRDDPAAPLSARQLARAVDPDAADASRTLLCLDVFRERGLLSLDGQDDRLTVTLLPVAGKVSLDDSELLLRLRAMAGN